MTRATQIIQSIKSHPEQWKSNGNNFKDDNGTAVWVGNWIFFVACDPEYNKKPCKFNSIEKFNIWRVYKKWQKLAV